MADASSNGAVTSLAMAPAYAHVPQAAQGPAMVQTYRVCFADTDALGIVYHARYFEMAERNHNELLLRLGISVAEMARDVRDGRAEIVLALHDVAAKFISPAFPYDVLTLETEIRRHTPARSRWRTTIVRIHSPICVIEAALVCINLRTGKAVMMPPTIDEAIGTAARERISTVSAIGA